MKSLPLDFCPPWGIYCMLGVSSGKGKEGGGIMLCKLTGDKRSPLLWSNEPSSVCPIHWMKVLICQCNLQQITFRLLIWHSAEDNPIWISWEFEWWTSDEVSLFVWRNPALYSVWWFFCIETIAGIDFGKMSSDSWRKWHLSKFA